ncbi:MAG: hypothetical protein ACYTG0_19090 [Planctomycetota bacterium]|jgi:hypothetical protein
MKTRCDAMFQQKQSFEETTSAGGVVSNHERSSPGRKPLSPAVILGGFATGLAVAVGLGILASLDRAPDPSTASSGGGKAPVAVGQPGDPPPEPPSSPPVPPSTPESSPKELPPEGTQEKPPAAPESPPEPKSPAKIVPPKKPPEEPTATKQAIDVPPVDPPSETSKVPETLAAARRAMWSRDLSTARRHVEAAMAAAQSPAERSEAERVERMLQALDLFWHKVREGAAGLVSTQELWINDTPIIVVEAGDGRLTVRVNGMNYTYAVGDVPQKLAVALAELRLAENDPTTDLAVGAFLAIDHRGDRQAARTRWLRAGPEGAAFVPEIDLAPPLADSAPGKPATPPAPPSGTVPSVPPTGGRPETAKPETDTRLPVPDAAARARAEREIRDLFGDEIQAARKPEGKIPLANRLAEVAGQVDDDPAARYVLLDMARSLALEVGDPGPLCRYIDEIGRHYQVDALGMKADAITESWQSPQCRPFRAALARESFALLEVAVATENYAAADKLIDVARSGARAVDDHNLLRQLSELARKIEARLHGKATPGIE